MQFLQVLQKASSLEAFKNDSVARRQADPGPVEEKYTTSVTYVTWSCTPCLYLHTRVHGEFNGKKKEKKELLSSSLIIT